MLENFFELTAVREWNLKDSGQGHSGMLCIETGVTGRCFLLLNHILLQESVLCFS